MEVSYLIGGLGALCAFGGGNFLWHSFQREKRIVVEQNAPKNAQKNGYISWRLRNGFRVLHPFADMLTKNSRLSVFAQEAVFVASSWGFIATQQSLLSVLTAVVIAVFVGASIVSTSLLCGIAVSSCFCAVVAAWLQSCHEKRKEALREAIPEAFRSMSICFQAGYSLLQTFSYLAQETKGPLQALFSQAAHRMEIGRSTQEALDVLRGESTLSELSFVAVALDVQHQTGGSMKQVLEAARSTVESELDLRRSLRVQTAQAALSARVVSVMPFILVALFSLISENFLEPYFSSPLGIALLFVALGMQGAGIFMVRRMLAIEVS